MRKTCGYPITAKLPASLGAAAAMCVILTTSASATDCRFLQRTIPELRAQCAGGSYCPDLEAFKSRAQQMCGQSYDPDGGSAGFETPGPVAEAEQPPPREPDPPPPVDQCADIPTDRAYFEAQIAVAVSEKTRFLREGVQDLQKIKSGLENEYGGEVGDPGSAREIGNYIKQTVRTIAALVDGLSGFAPTQAGAKVAVHSAQKWTAFVYKRYTEAELLLTSSDEILFEFSKDALAEMHPAWRAAKVTYDFANNIDTLRTMPREMDEARAEYARQIRMLDDQISKLTLKIKKTERETRRRRVDQLVDIFRAVKEKCLKEQPRQRQVGEPRLP